MGIGGTSSQGSSSNPMAFYAPHTMNGNIIAGNVGTGAVQQGGSSTAGGGSFDFKADIPIPPPVMLQNLDFFESLGKGMQDAAKYGSQAYKIGKQVAPVAGDMMKYVAPEHYEKYAVPATKNFIAAKDLGKSMGGWKAVDAMGHEFAGQPMQMPEQQQEMMYEHNEQPMQPEHHHQLNPQAHEFIPQQHYDHMGNQVHHGGYPQPYQYPMYEQPQYYPQMDYMQPMHAFLI